MSHVGPEQEARSAVQRCGPDVRITIVKIDRNAIRIGIEAPGHMDVYREEILPMDAEDRPSTLRFEAA